MKENDTQPLALEQEGKKSKPKKEKKRKKDKKKDKKSKKSKKEEISGDSRATKENEISPVNDNHIGGNSDSDSEDDEGLFDIAAKWAETKEHEDESNAAPSHSMKDPHPTSMSKNTSNRFSTPYNPLGTLNPSDSPGMEKRFRKPSNFSLHITNLPYNATKENIQKAFIDKECQVTSIRLVYNRNVSKTGEYAAKRRGENAPKSADGFTGVAFVDLEDEKSYDVGLKMDKTIWAGTVDGVAKQDQKGRGWRRRRINVRPTKTKQELAGIVERTNEKMERQRDEYHKKRDKKQGNDKTPGKTLEKNNNKNGKLRQTDKKFSKAGIKGQQGKRKRENDDGESKKKKRDKNEKLTKKERARKAAILMSKRRKK